MIFVILCSTFFISSWFNATVRAYWKHSLSFYWWNLLVFFFCFSSNQENLYKIHLNLDLFYDIYNTITEHNRRQSHYLSLIPNYFDIYLLVNQKSSFITASASSLIMISMLSLFEWLHALHHYLWRNKVICYC